MFGIAVALVPLLLLIFEAGTRMLRPHIDPLAVFVSSPQLQQDTQGVNTSGMFEFDPLLTWRVRPGLRGVWWDYTRVSTNSDGLRMERDVAPKRTGQIRIVTLGDSVTFGYRVPIARDREKPDQVEPGHPYPALMEEILRARYPGRAIEVLPLACPGYTSGQGLAWLRREIGALQPDIVTACFGWNNIRAAGLPDHETFPQTDAQVFARKIISRSQGLLYLTIEAASRNRGSMQERKPKPRTSPEEYTGHFEQMAEICRQRGAWFGIILPVYRDPNTPDTDPTFPTSPEEGVRMAAYRDSLRGAAKARSIPTLEIAELTETNWPASREFFGERIHPNAAGHQLMAERVAGFVDSEIQKR